MLLVHFLLPVPSVIITDVIGIWPVFSKILFVSKAFCDYKSVTLNFRRWQSDLKDTNVLHGGASTHLIYGGIFSRPNSVIKYFLLILTVKEF